MQQRFYFNVKAIFAGLFILLLFQLSYATTTVSQISFALRNGILVIDSTVYKTIHACPHMQTGDNIIFLKQDKYAREFVNLRTQTLCLVYQPDKKLVPLAPQPQYDLRMIK
ncbi:MAG: hypothetical protein KIT27_11910 [Legionellales bacterium]|nr:hypothetical protein [Legionellales bacterium]